MKLSAKQRATARALIGKKIARVALHPFDPADEEVDRLAYPESEPVKRTPVTEPVTDPVLWFTDGSCLRFLAEETEVGEYGIALIYPGRGSR